MTGKATRGVFLDFTRLRSDSARTSRRAGRPASARARGPASAHARRSKLRAVDDAAVRSAGALGGRNGAATVAARARVAVAVAARRVAHVPRARVAVAVPEPLVRLDLRELSIARVDPLPHQLEAVYGYFLRVPRIRFLLADDPGAGKTIMAGLTLKELKARGLVKRTLIVAPANLTFQWQREMADKFREKFQVITGGLLRANYGQNPWQDYDQAITSVSWVSLVEDARESLFRSRWDLIIVDEAHKMSARSEEHKTYAYRLGESLSKMTDHFLLMTATPHKGDPEHFRRFLALLDADVYGSIQSLQEAMRRQEAPFYLRRTKEALVTFPDPETGEVKKLFTKRDVRTASFELDGDEYDFYDALTRYVEDQSIKASQDDSARGRALSFTMAMLQRRFASSTYAVRRSLERMRKDVDKAVRSGRISAKEARQFLRFYEDGMDGYTYLEE